MNENKKGRNYNQSAVIFLSVIFSPILFCGACLFLWLHPWVTWLYTNEMQGVLENYERVRSAVFNGREQPERLLDIASESKLKQLQESLSRPNSLDKRYSVPQPINITEIREYKRNCSVVVVSPYFGSRGAAFVLLKSTGTWKVQRVYVDVDAGLFGDLHIFCDLLS